MDQASKPKLNLNIQLTINIPKHLRKASGVKDTHTGYVTMHFEGNRDDRQDKIRQSTHEKRTGCSKRGINQIKKEVLEMKTAILERVK